MSPELISLLEKGGYAALFVWLLYDSRKEARERERAAVAREERLTDIITKAMSSFSQFTLQQQQMTQAVSAIQANSAATAKLLDHALDILRRVQIEIGQLLGLMGESDPHSTAERQRS